jgi:hypothetical protein
MSDIYQPPKSNLENDALYEDSYGSIENGIRGEYQFEISEVLSEAWQKTAGAKGTFWLAFLIYIGISIGISIVFQLILTAVVMSQQDEALIIALSIVEQLLMNLILLPVIMGIVILGMRRSVDAPIQAGSIMGHYSSMWRLFFTMILVYVMVLIGFVLLIIPGIYLAIAYYMAMPLVVEKGLSPWAAMEISRKTVSKRWFTMFFFGIVMMLILIVSAIPLGIGLIWTLPMAMIAYGVIYRNMFGIRNQTLA